MINNLNQKAPSIDGEFSAYFLNVQKQESNFRKQLNDNWGKMNYNTPSVSIDDSVINSALQKFRIAIIHLINAQVDL
jgi:hypothetical protein